MTTSYICPKCGETRDESDYASAGSDPKGRKRKPRVYIGCKRCRVGYRSSACVTRYYSCSICDMIKPRDQFAYLGKHERRARCRDCDGSSDYSQDGDQSEVDAPMDRPTCRSQCVDGPRPCPWVGCRYHLWLDVSRAGTVSYRERGDDNESCALDVAEEGGLNIVEIGKIMAVSKQRVDQICQSAMTKMARSGELRGALGQPGVRR